MSTKKVTDNKSIHIVSSTYNSGVDWIKFFCIIGTIIVIAAAITMVAIKDGTHVPTKNGANLRLATDSYRIIEQNGYIWSSKVSTH